MARCCGNNSLNCSCLIEAGAHIQVQGSGSPQDPFVIIGDIGFSVVDSTVFNLTLTGTGTTLTPWALTMAYAASAKLDDVPDVNASAPTNGQVLGWDSATSKWTPRAPTTAASGSVLHDTSLTGDGSSGSNLAVRNDPTRLLGTTATGLGLTNAGINSTIRHFASYVDRDAASPPPTLNTFCTLDTYPGIIFFWNGAAWVVAHTEITPSYEPALLERSGPWVYGSPSYMFTHHVNTRTAFDGTFDMLPATTLGTAQGVLSVWFQETGSVGYKAIARPVTNHIAGTAYRLTDGSPFGFQDITGVCTAMVY